MLASFVQKKDYKPQSINQCVMGGGGGGVEGAGRGEVLYHRGQLFEIVHCSFQKLNILC